MIAFVWVLFQVYTGSLIFHCLAFTSFNLIFTPCFVIGITLFFKWFFWFFFYFK